MIQALALAVLTGITPIHEADCPFCKLKLIQNTEEQDNEVVLKFGNKKIEYRCVFCVIKDQNRYKGDLVVYAPSETAGEPVILKRTDGKWTAPKGAVFINSFEKHLDCSAQSRAFSKIEAYEAYVKKHKIEKAKPLTLEELLQVILKPAKDGKP